MRSCGNHRMGTHSRGFGERHRRRGRRTGAKTPSGCETRVVRKSSSWPLFAHIHSASRHLGDYLAVYILLDMARELPIFPLPIVLFPGAPQPLHIFEPRYRQLLQDCLAADRRFGIAYVAPDPAPDADPVPAAGEVGCVALIRSNQALPDGRSNILTIGERRFVLRGWISSTHPYRVAEIEEFDDDPTDAAEVTTLAADVREGVGRLARALGVLTEREDEEVVLASDPQLLSFQVAASLELDAPAKRALQALRSTSARLRQLATVLGPVAADAERRAAVRRGARGNGRGGRHPEIERAT